jgi:hypothetical protein
LCLAVLLFVPAAFPLRSAKDFCSCGMKTGCFCKMLTPSAGAHCDRRQPGRSSCTMRSSAQPAGAGLPVVLILRGWLRAQPSDGLAPPAGPTGAVMAVDDRPALFLSQTPESPPPKSFQAA